MSHKNYNFEIVANDFNSPLFRNEIWTGAFFKFPSLLGLSRLIIGIVSRKNQIDYICDLSTWQKCHDEVKERTIADYHYLENLIDQFIAHGEKMNNWSESNIFNKDLKQKTNQELIELLKTFYDLQSAEYAFGVALVVLDFQGFSFVENNLDVYLKSKVSELDYKKYYEIFTYPTHNSFAQDQEEDLLRLSAKYYDNEQWRTDVVQRKLGELQISYPDFYNVLVNHTKKYAWVYYVYAGPAFTEQNFLDFIKDYLARQIDPIKKIAELEKNKNRIILTKQQYLNKLKPNDFQRAILELAGKMVWAKPRRKDLQSKTYYHVEKLQREIAKRLFLSLDQVRSCTFEMLSDGLSGKEINLEKINELYSFHVCIPNDNTVEILSGQSAEDFVKKYVKIIQSDKDFSDVAEIKGVCACGGKATGNVKIINSSSDMQKMEYGDILVSVATTPSIVAAMKKAAAIITDEGGLTCHASIVSRELNIPCVIGVKIATKVLKDGDRVEVDATQSIIKKL